MPRKPKSKIRLKISNGGQITAIYSDALAPLLDQGTHSIARASHVEPVQGGWVASIVDGPALGANKPFKLRQEALNAEVAYIEQKIFG